MERENIEDTSLETLQREMESLLSKKPSRWSEDEKEWWDALCTEIERQKERSRVFDIGDDCVVVGYKLTHSKGACSFYDEYNKCEYDAVVTGYDSNTGEWEVIIEEDTLAEEFGRESIQEEKWRDIFISKRAGYTGYKMNLRYRGRLSETDDYRKEGLYRQ